MKRGPSTDPVLSRLGLDALTPAGRLAQSALATQRAVDSGHFGIPTEAPPAPNRTDRKSAEALVQRGVALLEAGDSSGALGLLRQALALDDESAAAHHALGRALLNTGQHAAATTSLRAAIARNPRLAGAHQDLGWAFDLQGFETEAIEAFTRATELSPRLPESQCRLAELLERSNRAEEAIARFRAAAIAFKTQTEGKLCTAKALLLERRPDAAETLIRKTLALDPTSAKAHNLLGGLLTDAGRLEDAAASFNEATRLDPTLYGAWVGLVSARKIRPSDHLLIEQIRRQLDRADLPDSGRLPFHFVLGKAHDDLGEYERAMHHFDAAHDLMTRQVRFDQRHAATWFDETIERCSPDALRAAGVAGTADPTPILIVGMPRSGTTLTEQIVSSHSAVAAGDELTYWHTHGPALEQAIGGQFPVEPARAATASYIQHLRRIAPGAARITDKLPFNFMRLGLLHALLPEARIIHCRRNPVDTCLSIYSILFNRQMDFARSKSDLAFFYRAYLRLMDHWRAVLPADRFLEVDYEDLIRNREAETRRLIAFLGLEWDDACLLPERNQRTVHTASAWQARQPVYTTSLERWRRYEPWLGELRELL